MLFILTVAASSLIIVPTPTGLGTVMAARIGAGIPIDCILLKVTLKFSDNSILVSPFMVIEMVLVSPFVPVKLKVPVFDT